MWSQVIKSSEFGVFLQEVFQKQELLTCSLSKLRKRETPYTKVSLRPLELKGSLHYQVTYHYAKKELHENLLPKQAEQLILTLLEDIFRQGHFSTPSADWQLLVSKKGEMNLLQHPPSRKGVVLDHNRSKQYLLKEGTAYPFLVELGVMNGQGKVLSKRYHKFRQLNKYLEIVADCLPNMENRADGEPLTIVDFGSGKAYLTFALYHYLVEHLELEVEIVGLDLKEDVVSFCNEMANKLGYDQLKFYHGDIRDYETQKRVDIMVSLHACDVATDYALAQAVKWQTQLILAVPCCQHEIYGQLEQNSQKVLLEHGIIKERVAALLTDSARAKLLETVGYSVRIMEFIDLEHTPKNLMIRAFREPNKAILRARKDYAAFKGHWKIHPTLESLLQEQSSTTQ